MNSYREIQSYVTQQQGYKHINESLCNFIIARVMECTYTNLDSTANYTSRLYGTAYCS